MSILKKLKDNIEEAQLREAAGDTGLLSVVVQGDQVRVRLYIDGLESEHLFSKRRLSGQAWALWAERNLLIRRKL